MLRFYQFGDGIFTTILKFEGKFIALKPHFTRISNGCRLLNLTNPFQDISEFSAFLESSSDQQSEIIKLIISSGETERLYQRKTGKVDVFIEKRNLSSNLQNLRNSGISLSISDLDYQPPFSDLSFLKLANYQPWSVIRNHNPFGYDTVCRNSDEILEATSGSVLLQTGNKFFTNLNHSNVLHSVTIDCFLEFAALKNLPLEKRKITVFDVEDSDSVFYANAAHGIIPVSEIKFGKQKFDYKLNSSVAEEFWKFYTACD